MVMCSNNNINIYIMLSHKQTPRVAIDHGSSSQPVMDE